MSNPISVEEATPPKEIAQLIEALHPHFDHNMYTIAATRPQACDCGDPDCRTDETWNLHVNPVYAGQEDDEPLNTMDVLGFCTGLLNKKVVVPESTYVDFCVGGDGALEIGTTLDTKEATPIRIYIYHTPMWEDGDCHCGQCGTTPRTIN